MSTGAEPSEHGIIGNGWYDHQHAQIMNWGRSDHLVAGQKIWEDLAQRFPGHTTANLFWRYCTHSTCDITVTERPTYFANGRKGADIYASTPELKSAITHACGAFPFFNFWGPKADLNSSAWICDVAQFVLDAHAPDLLLCYAPGLDYEGQRYGPRSEHARAVLRRGDAVFGRLIQSARDAEMDIALVSDYGFTEVDTPVYLNRSLRRAGFLAVDDAVNGELLEPGASRAFAVCDNQAAHIYVRDPDDIDQVRHCLLDTPGVRDVLGPDSDGSACLGHTRSGDLLAIAEPHVWFAYPYWLEEHKAPDFADCVDIFRKPGFDPCELFMKKGFGGKMHLAKRFFQLKTGIRAPFDVVCTDYEDIRGARNIRPESPQDGAVLITSWAQEDSGPIHMRDLKDVLLNRIAQTAS